MRAALINIDKHMARLIESFFQRRRLQSVTSLVCLRSKSLSVSEEQHLRERFSKTWESCHTSTPGRPSKCHSLCPQTNTTQVRFPSCCPLSRQGAAAANYSLGGAQGGCQGDVISEWEVLH